MSYVQRSREPGLGDITCWGIDLDRWRAEHQIPVFNDQYNVWYVQLAGESFSTAQAEDVAIRLIQDKWFGPQFSAELGVVDALASKVVTEPSSADGPPLRTITSDAPAVTWVDGPRVLVRVQFVYRGSRTSVPWPVFSQDMFGPYCPKGIRAGVVYSFNGQAQGVPPQDRCSVPGAWTRDPECIKRAAGKWAPSFSVPWWAWATVGVAGALAVGPYVWPVVAPVVRSWTSRAGKVIASERARSLNKKKAP